MIEPIVRIRIELEGTDPLVWRSVDVPLSSTLMALHDIIQVTMRWQDAHTGTRPPTGGLGLVEGLRLSRPDRRP